MLVSSRYSGLELPVYDAEDVPITDVRAIDDAAPGDTFTEHTILRTVELELGPETPPPGSLQDFLDITDKELDTAATLCRAEVVGHQWGLVYDPEGIHFGPEEQAKLCQNAPGFVPRDHFLVAEVDIIRNLIEMRPRNAPRLLAHHALATMAVGIGVKAYKLLPHTKGYGLWDLLPKQLGIGTCEKTGDTEPRMRLLDIEPRLISD